MGWRCGDLAYLFEIRGRAGRPPKVIAPGKEEFIRKNCNRRISQLSHCAQITAVDSRHLPFSSHTFKSLRCKILQPTAMTKAQKANGRHVLDLPSVFGMIIPGRKLIRKIEEPERKKNLSQIRQSLCETHQPLQEAQSRPNRDTFRSHPAAQCIRASFHDLK